MDRPICFPDVLSAARRGDEAAFVTLFRATQPRLLRYLGVTAGALADDIAADTWVSVVRDLNRFEGDRLDAFHAWVLNIARRRWIDEVRRRSRRPESPAADLPEQDAGQDVATSVASSDAAERITALVRRLPPDQAEVVTLRVVMGFDIETTAAAVGKKPGAVRVLAHRGLRRLAVLLEEAGWAPGPADPATAAVTVNSQPTISTRGNR